MRNADERMSTVEQNQLVNNQVNSHIVSVVADPPPCDSTKS